MCYINLLLGYLLIYQSKSQNVELGCHLDVVLLQYVVFSMSAIRRTGFFNVLFCYRTSEQSCQESQTTEGSICKHI